MTALHRAAPLHDTEAVRLLLEYGADPNDTIVSSIDETALLLALERPGGTDIIALLIENKTNLRASLHQDLHSASSQPFNQYLIEAVTNKDSKSVELLVDKGADINVLPALCQPSALQTAIEADDIEKVDMLLALGADPIGRLPSNFSTTDSELTLPLTAAARYHGTIATQKLIRAGANIDDFIPSCSNAVYSYRWSKTNQTALQASIESCNYDITRLLLRHGTDPNIRDCSTSTALQQAARAFCHHQGQWEIIILLLLSGADVNTSPTVGFESENVLQAAARTGDLNLMKLLMYFGGNPFMKTFDLESLTLKSFTCFLAAIVSENMHLVLFLYDLGADINEPAEAVRQTALQAAASLGNIQLLDWLLYHGADVNRHHGYFDNTPLSCI
ncbi:hypothetical protein BFJ72_g13454 [Fusarium proliferatum]|uniref:Uncharacterized protein n=1 Tax=Gibberella intermedia TaxID=948311 RepID=A0A420SCD6_GIBIN|nr:hypothetical protein BFJ72_g13454 [Fusarium proliferatum]